MTFLEKIKSPGFFSNVLKVTIPFFIIVVILDLLFFNFKNVISFNFSAIAESAFNNGKWKQFFIVKIVFSVLYGFWMALKKTR